MPGSKVVSLSAESLVNLLTHYTDGKVPLDAKLLQIAQHTLLQRELGLLVESQQWDDKKLPGEDAYAPLYIGYDGKHVMTWGRKDQEVTWWDAPEGPGE